jgi:phosphotransferase system enzyme I (PtsI)
LQVLKGVCLSKGVAVGPVYRFNRDLLIIPEHTIEPNQIDAELESLKTALQKATTELEEIRTLLEHHLDQEHARMIEAQIMALTDIELLKIIENDVRMNHRNVVQAYWEAMNLYENLLKESTYVYQQQRLCDLQDVKRRVIHHLQIEEAYASPQLGAPAIFVSERISPSDIINLYHQSALGIITRQGGRDSHAAILARALSLPYLSGVVDLDLIIHSQEIILSADEELIILDAPLETRQHYLLQVQKFNRERQMTAIRSQKAMTRDKVLINLWANAGFLPEVENLTNTMIHGIGLFRTEYLCLTNNAIPDEEEQFRVYSKVAVAMKDKPVVFRTFDFGRDKLLSILDLSSLVVNHSAVGEGGLRFCLENPWLLRTQLRALLRASAYGKLQIMFPMVFSCADVVQGKQILSDVQAELRQQAIAFDPQIPIGAMVETTQILGELPALARQVDFFSIGTNDLTFYLLKITRQRDTTKYYYHPLLFQTLAQILATAEEFNLPVTVCGEMAADPLAALGLLALGFRSLSVNPPALFSITQLIRKVNLKKLTPLRTAILQAQNETFLQQTLENWR